jgi:hypothetical protein
MKLGVFEAVTALLMVVTMTLTCMSKALGNNTMQTGLPVQVHEVDGSLISDNGIIRVRLRQETGRIVQEFHGRRDGRWVPVLQSFAPQRPAPEETIPLYLSRQEPEGQRLEVADEHRLLVPERLSAMRVEQHGEDQAVLILSGLIGETRIEQSIRLRRGEPWVHIEVNAMLASEPPRLEYLLSPFAVEVPNPPKFTHLPAHKRGPDYVAGDRMFFSPIVMVQDGKVFAAIVPDLDVLNEAAVSARNARQHPDEQWLMVPVEPDSLTMPAMLDLELQSGATDKPLLTYGLMDTFVRQHVFFQHDHARGTMVRTLGSHEVRYAMDLFIDADAPPDRGYQIIAPHLWQRYGQRYFAQPRPQAMPFEQYPTIVYPAWVRYQGYEVIGGLLLHRDLPGRPEMNSWQQWEADGIAYGGWRLSTPHWYDLIYFTPWFNNVSDALGMHYWGTRMNNEELIDSSRRIINLILSAPQNEGMFPTLYKISDGQWSGSMWRPPGEDDYDPNAAHRYFNVADGAYQSSAASSTAGYLLEYHLTCEEVPVLLDFVQRYADFLSDHMDERGCVPAWFDDDLQPLPSMRSFNADGGAHVWVLAETYRVRRDPRHLEAARRAAQFLMTEVIPQQRWIDFECFYSCAVKPETFFDPRTGQGARNTMSMIWAMRGFLSLFEVTQEHAYLDAAEAVADYASLFQAVWDPHFVITAYPFGGYSPQIGDAEWLDQRSNVMAGPMVRLGLALNRQDLLERGVALARSGLALMNHPLHRENEIYRFSNFPRGLGPENIDHAGFPQLPLGTAPTWSTVGTMTALADVSRLLGGVYVDVQNELSVGTDGVTLREMTHTGRELRIRLDNQLAKLRVPHEQPFNITLVVTGLPDEGDYRLVINGSQVFEATAAELANFTLRIDPAP